VTFLGTAAARFFPPANTAALLLRLGAEAVLVDCGVGAVRQLGRAGVSPEELTAVFLTHWHPDHVAGLPRLVRQVAQVQAGGTGPVVPLRLFAPRAPRWTPWGAWSLRLASGGRPVVEHVAVGGGEAISLAGVGVVAIETEHSAPSVGWAFSEVAISGGVGRRVVVSGDTRPNAGIAAAARGADLLVHEATYLDRHAALARARKHTTALEAARVARDAGVGMLALTHLGMAAPREALLAEAGAVFERVVVARDLDELVVGAGPEPLRR
jgi:ribonuclease Z